MKFRRLRKIFAIVTPVLFLVALMFTALTSGGDSRTILALVILGIASLVEPAFAIWDRFVPDPQFKTQPRQPADEKMYLEGRLAEFAREEKWFVELAGETAIQTRFDAYGADFIEGRAGRVETFEDIREAAEKFDQFVIVGDPGAGKSTSLRKLATDEARKYLKGESTLLPLWINLGFSENPVNAEELLRYWWHERYLQERDIRAYLNTGLLWLFLDGLNEMPESGGSRKERANKIRGFLQQHPNVRAVVTCRVNDYVKPVSWARHASPLHLTEGERKKDFDDGLTLDLPVVRVQPLDEGRIQEFIQRRLGQLTLWDEIQKSDALGRMASNPYNLAMLIEIYGGSGQLPKDLNQLYSLYVRVRYDEYAKRKLVKSSWEDLERKLQRLAYRMIDKGSWIAVEIDWAQRQIGRKVLKDSIDLGVIVQDKDAIRFYHQSLHGFFALPGLRDAIQSKKTFVEQNSFIQQIGNLGETAAPAVPALIEALYAQNADVRLYSAEALENIGQAAAPAVPALMDVLRGEDDDLREFALDALTAIGESSVPALVEALHDPVAFVRGQAADILGRIGEAAAPAVPDLMVALREPDEYVRMMAAQALANIGQEAALATSALLGALHDKSYKVRRAAAWALGNLGQAAAPAVPALIELLNDYLLVRESAAWALEKINTPEAQEALKRYRAGEL